MAKTVRIGLIGCGVVGGGVVEALRKNGDRIKQSSGMEFEVIRIAVRDLDRPRNAYVDKEKIGVDWRSVVTDPAIDLIIEATSGGVNPSYEVVKTALEHGKNVVSANKELVARHGIELSAIAQQHGLHLIFEASVLGGIPALYTLKTYFQANRIRKIRGIVNGTCNYILTNMSEAGAQFADALREAQAAGFAEEDPSMDVLGYDAYFKLQILTRMAFAFDTDWSQVVPQGITEVEAVDLALARSLGYKIKHVVQAELTADKDSLLVSNGPVLVGPKDRLYQVDGVTNALCIEGDLVGEIMLLGPGAGSMPTASAIVEDLIKIMDPAQENWLSALQSKPNHPGRASTYLVRSAFPITNEQPGSVDVQLGLPTLTVRELPQAQALGYRAWVTLGEEQALNQILAAFDQAIGAPCIGYALHGHMEESMAVADAEQALVN